MIILNAGIPRSGTVLVNSILQQAFACRGVAVQSQNSNHVTLPDKMRSLMQSYTPDGPVQIVHLHSWDDVCVDIFAKHPERFISFANIRDPRDCVVSLMRLHDFNLEKACGAILRFIAQFIRLQRQTKPMVLRYEHLIENRPAFIDAITLRAGLFLSAAEITKIETETSLTKMATLSEAVDQGEVPTRVLGGNRRPIREHPKTHLTDRHIQSGATGRWKQELSPSDAEKLRVTMASACKYFGYE